MSASEVAYLAAAIRDVLAGEVELNTEYSCVVQAEQRWFAVNVTRFPGPGPKRAVISYENITESTLSHRRRTMEHAVVSVLAESTTLAEAMPKLIRTMCEAMDWAYGARWAWVEENQELRRLEYWSENPLELNPADAPYWETLQAGERAGLLRRALFDREATWIADVQREPSFRRRPSAQKLGLVSAYSFPIVASGRIIGMMEFFGRDVRQPDEMLLLITRSVGTQIGQYVQRKEAEEALRLSEERFRITISQASVGITVTSLDLRYLIVNEKYCELLGYTRAELLARSVRDVVIPDEYEEAVSFRRKMIEGEERTLYREKQLVRKDGSLVWTNLATSLVRGEGGEPKHFISVIQDISDKKRAEIALRESEEKFNQLASNIPQVFWISDAALKETIYMSPVCEEMLGLSLDDLKKSPRNLVRVVHPEDRLRVYHARRRAAAGQYDEIYRIIRPDGSVRWIQDRAFPVRDANNLVYRIAGIAEDITHRKEAEEKLVYLAHYDGLTALPNRTLFLDRLRQTLAQARRRDKLVAIMFLDLDRFKITNDTLGHSAGDELLTQVAARLLDRVRVGDTVGRFGGDEFGLILSDLRTVEDARLVAHKIMNAFEEPFVLERSEVYVSGSIGISMYPADSDDEGTLMKNADAAMYRAKESGRNNFQFYTSEMNAQALHRLDMESSLRRALERDEFLLHYQPKVSLSTGQITGVEALLRWARPGGAVVQPAEFVPLLEDSGLIVSIGEWLMDAACREIKAWKKSGITPVPIAINLSARQFAAKDLAPMIQRVLAHHAIPADLLQLEITESCLMGNTTEAVQLLSFLKSLGLHLSIDDFGTGYSSLAYLRRFPIDALKIDRSFVSDITTDVDDATIIRAVIGMAHSLGLKVVAEGVENEAQLTFLTANGCDEMQGYYYSPPLSAEDCTVFLRRAPSLLRTGRWRTAASR
jgi:diguanylate cyclase (GGDEF)-like protein/PAS domain S-box-containing protein